MPAPAYIVRTRRERRREGDRRRGRLRLSGVVTGGILISFAAALLILAAALAYADLTHDLPNIQYLPILLSPPDGLLLRPTRLYDRTGEHLLATLAPVDATRRYLPLNPRTPVHLPQHLADAAVALLDPEFWTHDGYTLDAWQDPSLHSTLAQRIVFETLLYDEEPSVRRALRERLLAAQATREFGRTQILEWFLNYADYGNLAIGAEAASQIYLGKSAADLTLGESALLAGSASAPDLNPIEAPDLAVARRNAAIAAMRSLGRISEEDEAAAKAEPAPAPRQQTVIASAAPAFVRLVRSQLDQEFPRSRLELGGLAITTTLDFELQMQAACTSMAFVARLEGEGDPSAPCASAERLPALPPDTRIPAPAASAVILDPNTGQVLAAVGETLSDLETESLAAHDPGSLAYPFIYLAAFTRGYSPASLTWDIPPADEAPRPGTRHLGPVRMRIALANDLEAPALALASQLGSAAVKSTEASFGLRSESASLLEVAGAYSVFAAGGIRYGSPGPTTVLRVEGADHAMLLDMTQPRSQSVLAAPLAYLMNNVLSDEQARELTLGSLNPLDIERPAAAKIGSTAAGTDSWAVGYTPSRVAAVWVGTATDDSTLGRSPRVAASLWNALMQTATTGLPPAGWLLPAGVTAVDVCDPSGMLPTGDCPSIVNEIFINGNEPVESDTLYRRLPVNRETGLLATVFTPEELVEERLYMVLPAEAMEWAAAANVPIAPTGYDAIQIAPVNPDVRITAPAMFAAVSGQVQIRGTATAADFDRYRILVGQGLNPQSWVSIGGEPIDPVEDGVLATWDTAGLSGLYAIQLQVIHTDQRVDSALIQVTLMGS